MGSSRPLRKNRVLLCWEYNGIRRVYGRAVGRIIISLENLLKNAGNRDGGREGMDKKPRQYVQSLDRALDIIEELAGSGESLKVTELSERLALHKSTVHRLLATLLYRGYAEQDENGRYKVGLKLFEIAGRVLNKMDLRKRVKPFLVRLQQETRETIHLGILDHKDVVYIDK